MSLGWYCWSRGSSTDSFHSAKSGQLRASTVSFLECRLWWWQNLVRNPSLHDLSLFFDLDAEIICKSTAKRNAKHLTENQNIYLSTQLQLKVTLWMEKMDIFYITWKNLQTNRKKEAYNILLGLHFQDVISQWWRLNSGLHLSDPLQHC